MNVRKMQNMQEDERKLPELIYLLQNYSAFFRACHSRIYKRITTSKSSAKNHHQRKVQKKVKNSIKRSL